jgi:hypothetical protein
MKKLLDLSQKIVDLLIESGVDESQAMSAIRIAVNLISGAYKEKEISSRPSSGVPEAAQGD